MSHTTSRKSRRGFTLVEILIVVIILGILAAIVIPQFTNASNDARNNSVASTLQTLRSQIELFKIQHNDTPPAAANLVALLTGKSSTTETSTNTATGTAFGPYVQTFPTNPVVGSSAVVNTPTLGSGWYYQVNGTTYTVQALDAAGAAMTY